MSEKFKWAILGLGNIAERFAEDLRLIDDAELVVVGSRSLDRAREFAIKFGARQGVGSYREIFTVGNIDAVYVATPHVQHQELTLLCIEHGVSVLCEKPLGLNLAEVETVAAAARSGGVYLMEALWTRFLPSTLKLKGLIDAGEIGEILSVRSDFGFRATDLEVALPPYSVAGSGSGETTVTTSGEVTDKLKRNRILNPALGGGALLDIGIYPQFLAQFLFGEPERINATARLSAQGVDLDTQVTCVHAGGRLSHNYSTVLGLTKIEALIIGTTGNIHWHPRWHEPSSFSILRGKDAPPENFYFDYAGANGYKYEAEAVMADVRAGRTENELWSLDDSLALHRTLSRVREQIGVRYPGE
ncbi:Gfo/Idh/MocA family protein [Neolewinella antarctica]|uniref:Dehydrogenase n=1 Tax=Neolewinella antarctica TaxID=442734 RepID=A0ABX0XBZ4_9BACT|nr:Gfo/Idh/MocA family oxidoreductase [Neolewinella antarctica]NJC26297.1 putative dehydrogenase [Neolewinella antarctica]